jgi:hypothetical protein
LPERNGEEKMKSDLGNKVIEAVKGVLMKQGFCGVADGDNNAMLNSDDGNGNDIIVKIEVKPE